MASFSPVPRDIPSIVSGLRDSTSVTSTRLIADVKDTIALYQPEAYPITAITMKMKERRKVTQSQFYWMSQDEYPRRVTVSGAQTAGDTALEVATDHGGRVAANWVMVNTRTGENVYVSSVATDTLTVVRGIGGINAAMNDGDELVFTRAVFEDGADFGTMKSIKEDAEFNYTEIIRTQYGVTGRQAATSLYGGDDLPFLRKVKGIEHAVSIEHALIFGRRHTRTGAGGHPHTFMGGINYFTKTNRWNLNGNIPKKADFTAWLEHVMTLGLGGNVHGSGVKYFFGSARWMSTIESWADEKIQYRPMDKTIGIKVGKYQSAHGEVNLIRHPLLVGPVLGGMGLLLDLNHLGYAYHQERDTKLLKNREGNGIDGEQEEYLTDCGLEFELEAAHSITEGLPTS